MCSKTTATARKNSCPRPGGLILVPREGVVEVRLGKRPNEHPRHLPLPFGDVDEYVAPRSAGLRIAGIRLEPLIKDGPMLVGDRERV